MELFKVVLFNISRNRKNFFLSAFGIVIGVTIFVFFTSLSEGMKRVVNDKIFDGSANFIKIKSQSNLLTENDITDMKSWNDVDTVFPMQNLDIPFMISGSILGKYFRMEAIAYGMDPKMIEKDLLKQDKEKYKFEYKKEKKYVPVVLSREVFEIYNGSYAASHGMPKLAPEILTNYTFNITLGSSIVRTSSKGKRKIKARIVGVSKYVPLGFAIPIGYTKEWRKFYVNDTASEKYDRVVLKAKTKSSLTALKTKISKNKNFIIITDNNERINFFITVVMMLFVIISLIIIFISAVNIMQTFYTSINTRLKEIAILRALGATKKYIRNMILLESTLIGIFSGIIGMFLALMATFLIDWYSNNKLPDFPYKPDTFFSFPLWLILIVIPFATLFCILGAYLPARKAANNDPSVSLSAQQ